MEWPTAEGERLPVTVQWRGRPEGDDRPARKQALRGHLHQALARHPEVDVDWSTVSLAGQTVEAEIPADRFATTVEQLRAAGLRVDVVHDRQVIPDPET